MSRVRKCVKVEKTYEGSENSWKLGKLMKVKKENMKVKKTNEDYEN